MDKKKLIAALAALLAIAAAALVGWSLSRDGTTEMAGGNAQVAAREEERRDDVCASSATYSRLKQLAFEQAARGRTEASVNFDTLAAHSVVRMEDPVVRSRDEALGATVCAGRMVLELPPGAERAFGGERRLVADVDYAAQPAADGSGIVYTLRGAEPIVRRLAAFDLGGRTMSPPLHAPAETGLPGETPPSQMPADIAPDHPLPTTPQVPSSPVAAIEPSFACGDARTRGERIVCASPSLAAKDRAMSSSYRSALADADRRTRRALRRTRDAFLAYRDRCPDEACVSQAYDGRMTEIRDIRASAD